MNYSDRMLIEARIRTNLSEWMATHGEILSDKHIPRPYSYYGIRIRVIYWRRRTYKVTDINGWTEELVRID